MLSRAAGVRTLRLSLSQTLSETLSQWCSSCGGQSAAKMLSHQKLKVYEKALTVAAGAERLSADWGKRHAVVDQFCRAAESIVLNIAEGSRLRSGPDKARTLDFALGSTLECAACLDIASIKSFLSLDTLLTEKADTGNHPNAYWPQKGLAEGHDQRGVGLLSSGAFKA